MKKNFDYWKNFIMTGKIDDYLNYIACTQETTMEEFCQRDPEDKEGGFYAGIDYSDGNGAVGHTSW